MSCMSCPHRMFLLNIQCNKSKYYHKRSLFYISFAYSQSCHFYLPLTCSPPAWSAWRVPMSKLYPTLTLPLALLDITSSDKYSLLQSVNESINYKFSQKRGCLSEAWSGPSPTMRDGLQVLPVVGNGWLKRLALSSFAHLLFFSSASLSCHLALFHTHKQFYC